ncbi:MAG: metallopeptidase TldD-related protein [Gammaproteobacteria bacterium]|nr:metallopeptidase TldD-related protein [Gammaproteobacteria bacterium]MDH5800046.1 metallopeptidase TldD-related protein [Gammaproteobacteria bacterium]
MGQQYFQNLWQSLCSQLSSTEILLLNYQGENTHFARFNNNRIRQSGYVQQQELALNLIRDQRQCTVDIQLTGDMDADMELLTTELNGLRQQLQYLPEDPYLYFNTEVQNSEWKGDTSVVDAIDAVDQIIQICNGLDLVGIWASGGMQRGFANSLGQFNWHSQANFNFDWSVYLKTDKAVKQSYAGTHWQVNSFEEKITQARNTLEVLRVPPKTIKPGKYRVFLTPDAINEILCLLSWGGFGLKSHRTAQTPLLKMIEDRVCLNKKFTLVEQHAKGLTPRFTDTGFLKPDNVVLIENGAYKDCLSGTRSAKEYGATVNCSQEVPQSLGVTPGNLAMADVLKALDTGIWISNLWYCNYSDRNNGRMTGMTRFACLWVERGKVVAPLSVMRFDESIFNLLGENLLDLTKEQEWILDNSTYERRSTVNACLPGVLVDDFNLTL